MPVSGLCVRRVVEMDDESSEHLADAASTLLCAPAMGSDGSDACLDLLSVAPPSESSVLWVTYTRSAAACLEDWRAHVDEDPARMAVVVLDDSGVGGDAPEDIDTVETGGNPGDITGLGITIGRYLEEWSGPIAVCFDSLTALLQYTDLETAYEFLHTLDGRLYAVGAKSHFHLDPTAHDDRTVTILTSLFDASVTVEDGERVVKTRFV